MAYLFTDVVYFVTSPLFLVDSLRPCWREMAGELCDVLFYFFVTCGISGHIHIRKVMSGETTFILVFTWVLVKSVVMFNDAVVAYGSSSDTSLTTWILFGILVDPKARRVLIFLMNPGKPCSQCSPQSGGLLGSG